MGKGLLIIILGSMMTMAMVSMTFIKTANSGLDNALGHYEEVMVRNMGNSMVNILLSRLADDFEYRLEDYENKEYLGGEVEFKVIDSVLESADHVIAGYNLNRAIRFLEF